MPRPPDLGPQNPDLKNSPISWETDEDPEEVWLSSPEEPACYFNGKLYPDGTVVKSENLVLQCQRGLWIPIASSDPDNP